MLNYKIYIFMNYLKATNAIQRTTLFYLLTY